MKHHKGIQEQHPPKASGHKGHSPDPDVSHSSGQATGHMGKPKSHASGMGSNKAGGGRDANAAKAL